jgi:hypothetical protein
MKHNLKLFEKNINNKFKLLPILVRKNKIGNIKYLAPFFKEWKNTGYFYNKNSIINLSIINLLVNKFIRVYFNLFLTKYKKNKISKKKRNKLLNNIYISKAEIKFTNSISIITIYTLNNLNSILKKYEEYTNYLINKKEQIQKNKNYIRKIQNKYLTKKWPISILNKFIRPNLFNYVGFKPYFLKKNNKNMDIIFYSNLPKTKFNNIKDIIKFNINFYNKKSELFYLEMIKLRLYNIKKEYLLYLKIIWKYNIINSSNFIKLSNNNNFILKLKRILSRIINKKIELNIVNMKYLSYNPDFFTKFLSLKLKKNKFNIIKSMRNIINRSKIDISKYNILNDNKNLIENKYEDLSLISIINKKNFTDFLKEIYNTNIIVNKNIFFNNYNKIYNIIFNIIKYKNIGGIRLEIKGRLTKRYRADRSIYKLLWKGGLKNKDSSIRGLSSTVFRGNFEPNMMYSISKNKRRIGAFAVKGWISGK